MNHTLIYRVYGKVRQDNVAMIDRHLDVIQQSHQSIMDFFTHLEYSKKKAVTQFVDGWWKRKEDYYLKMSPQLLIGKFRNSMIYGDNTQGKALYKIKELIASVDVNNDAIEIIESLIHHGYVKQVQAIPRYTTIVLEEDTSASEKNSNTDPTSYCECKVCSLKYSRARVKNSTNYGQDYGDIVKKRKEVNLFDGLYE